MAKTLTAVAAMNYRPSKERREIPDGGCPGLYLVVQRSGHKSWALRFRRPNGKPAKLTLGSLDLSGREAEIEPIIGHPLTLAAARALAAEIGRQRNRDRDVIEDFRAEKRRRRFALLERGSNTFGRAACDFIEGHAKKKTRRWKEQANLLGLKPTADGKLEFIRHGIAERWLDKPTTDVDGHDIYGLVDETRRRGVPGLKRRGEGITEARARAMMSCLSKMFSWLVQHRRIEKSPCVGVHRPEAPKARDRVLSDLEILKFWDASDLERKEFSSLLKLLLLTGCRLNEVAGMMRSELSDDLAIWSIPGNRTKNKRPHMVPLAPLAQKLVSSERDGLVFTTDGESKISGWSKIKARLDDAMKIPHWRLHDLRRTAATGMAEIGIHPHIVEACLNHVSGAKAGVAGTYNRAAYAPEKKVALKRWADHLEGLVAGRKAKVVPLRKG